MFCVGLKKNMKKRRRIGFVASTLPFQYIVKNFDILKLELIVCASYNLRITYEKGFRKNGIIIDVESLKKGRITSIVDLFLYLIMASVAVIFHECCWRNIDVLMLILKNKYEYYPNVGLEGRTLVKITDIKYIKDRIEARFLQRWFDYYETPKDGEDGVYYSPAVKNILRKPSKELITNKKTTSVKNHSRRVLVISSKEVLPTEELKNTYVNIINALVKKGITVDIKDHPNPSSRIDFEDLYECIDPDLPLTCLNLLDYRAFISVASTGLAEASEFGKIISIAKLLPNKYQDQIGVRMKHLSSIGVDPDFPKDIDELVKIICD